MRKSRIRAEDLRHQMHPALVHFLDPGIKYELLAGPDAVPDLTAARISGMNCVVLAHLAIRDLFDVTLPPNLRCFELFRDSVYTQRVPEVKSVEVGDLLWFGRSGTTVADVDSFVPDIDKNGWLANWQLFPVTHVGIIAGLRREQAEPLVLHASQRAGTVVAEPLDEVMQHPRYAEVVAIDRLVL